MRHVSCWRTGQLSLGLRCYLRRILTPACSSILAHATSYRADGRRSGSCSIPLVVHGDRALSHDTPGIPPQRRRPKSAAGWCLTCFGSSEHAVVPGTGSRTGKGRISSCRDIYYQLNLEGRTSDPRLVRPWGQWDWWAWVDCGGNQYPILVHSPNLQKQRCSKHHSGQLYRHNSGIRIIKLCRLRIYIRPTAVLTGSPNGICKR